MFYEQPHQPLGVEDEFIAARLLVPADPSGFSKGAGNRQAAPAPQEDPHLMMVCMPRTCGVLLRTLSVRGRGWHWCAEASAALGTQVDWGLRRGFLFPEPHPPTPTVCRDSGVCRVGAASSWLIGGTPPFSSQAKVKGYGGRYGDDHQQEARSCGVSPSTGRPRTLRGSRRGPTVGRWASHMQTRPSPQDSLRQLVPKPRALLAGGTAEPWRQTPALTLHSR